MSESSLAVNKELWNKMEERHKVLEGLYKNGEADKLVKSIYANNCKAVTPEGKTLAGKPEILDFMKSELSSNMEFNMRIDEVNGEGDWAFVRGTYKRKSGTNVDNGKYVTVWKKVDGEFLIYNDIWNSSKSM